MALTDDSRHGVPENDGHPYLSWLGVETEIPEAGRSVLRVPYDRTLTNVDAPVERPPIHGGVIATLIDSACFAALQSRADRPESVYLTTMSLNVNYVRPATSDLTAEGEAVRLGGTQGVAEVTVSATAPDGVEKAVATGGATFHVAREDAADDGEAAEEGASADGD